MIFIVEPLSSWTESQLLSSDMIVPFAHAYINYAAIISFFIKGQVKMMDGQVPLIHWGMVTHIWVHAVDDVWSMWWHTACMPPGPNQSQWTLLIGSIGINLCEIGIYKNNHMHSRKCVNKLHLQNVGHVVLAQYAQGPSYMLSLQYTP